MASTPQPKPLKVRFSVYEFDQSRRELLKHGLRIKVQRQPLEILVALLERPGAVVTREELRLRLWAGRTFVEYEDSLNTAVRKLRAVLSDSAETPHYIETVAGQGYRFIAPVQQIAPMVPALSSVPPAPPRIATPRFSLRARWLLLSGALLVAIAAIFLIAGHRSRSAAPNQRISSLAVLPLKNLSSDPQEEYFSEGLTDELITRLASLHGLRVISRTSIMQYKDSSKPLPVIARELNVDAVVEGTVLRDGGRVRITAQLIEAGDDRHLWADSYERDQRDILGLQNEVTRNIAEKIQLNLEPAERQRLSQATAVDPVAHEDYLRGRYHWSRRRAVDLQSAIGYFQQAVARQPDYARAYAGLADCYALMAGYSFAPPNDAMPKARAAAVKALELDKDLAEAHTSLALIAQNYDWDWATAESEYRQAIALDPNYATAHHWYAEHLAEEGRFEEAFAEMERARQLDPQSLIIAVDQAVFLYFARRYDRAIAQFRVVLAADPNFPRANMITSAYVQLGQFQQALADIAAWHDSQDAVWTMAWDGYTQGRAGHREAAERALATLRHMQPQQLRDPMPRVYILIGLDRRDEAIAGLREAYVQHNGGLAELKVDPLYDPLRGDPRFQQLLRRIGLAR